MASQLSAIARETRRRMAATLGLFAVLFVAIGAVAAVGTGRTGAPVFAAVAIVIALVLALVAWGLLRTVAIDNAEQRLDGMIEQTLQSSGAYETMCGCGHEHDPGELHITDAEDDVADHRHSAACSHDGSGAACAHDCHTCVLAALRPSPVASRPERASS